MARFNPLAPAVTGPVVRVVVQTKTLGQLYENTFDYMATAPVAVNTATLVAFLTAWEAACKNPYRNCLSPQSTYQGTFASELTVGQTPTQQTVDGISVGTAGATSFPGTVACVMTKRTSLKGQRGRGRFFMPSLPNTFIVVGTAPNVPSAAAQAAYATLNTALLGVIAAGGGVWALAVTGRPVPPATLTSTGIPVSSIQVQLILGTIRRRREGVGI